MHFRFINDALLNLFVINRQTHRYREFKISLRSKQSPPADNQGG